MHDTAGFSGWDTFVLMLPFIGMMAVGMFGLDEGLATSKGGKRCRRSFCGEDGQGRPLLSDPDGRPWQLPASTRPSK